MAKKAPNPLPSLDNDRIIVINEDTKPDESNPDDSKPDESQASAGTFSIRLVSTHPTGSRFRGGLKFTYEEVALNMAELSSEQLEEIKNDPVLVVKEIPQSDKEGDA